MISQIEKSGKSWDYGAVTHLQQYLTLEKFRFNCIHIKYDLETMDFMLPSLTLQPIVENAVKHAILKRPEGGTITIATRIQKDAVCLTVRDDGVGFDTNAAPTDSRSHIGISNVRSRIEVICSGTMSVESVLNKGTTVTFVIPMEGRAQ